jgi:hypothetical protein
MNYYIIGKPKGQTYFYLNSMVFLQEGEAQNSFDTLEEAGTALGIESMQSENEDVKLEILAIE